MPVSKNRSTVLSAVCRTQEKYASVYAANEQLYTETAQQKGVSLDYGKLLSRHRRQTEVSRTQSDDIWGHPNFENHQEPIKELLMQYKWKLEARLEALSTQCSTKNTLCALAHSLLRNIAINIRQIQRAASLREIRQQLDKLQSITLDACSQIKNIASPPFLAKFVNLRTDIFLELSVSQFDPSQLLTQKREIIGRIQKLIARIETSQTSSIGQLSRDSIRTLEWGYRERKNHLILAKSTIGQAQTNDEIAKALHILRKSIARSNWILKPVLRSPEQHLQEQSFAFLGKLYALRANLGEEAPVAS